MARRESEDLTGLGPDAASIAYSYLCKGFGRHQVDADGLARLPEGVVEAVVREFTPFGEQEPGVGCIDVVFVEEDGMELCYYEFRVEVSGRGGFAAGRLVSK
jgi:hypothetical protein